MNLIVFESWYLLSAGLFITFVIYWYFTRNFNYWKERGIDGPKPLIGFGNLLAAIFKPMPLLEIEFNKKYGKIYGVFSGNTPALTVNDPELIKMILVKDFHLFVNRRKFNTDHTILDQNMLYSRDDKWKRLRSIASPIFTSAKMKIMYPLLMECVEDYMNHLKIYAQKGKDINLKEMCANFSLDVIAKCAFATKINPHKDSNNPFIKNARNIFNPKPWKIVPALLFPTFVLKVLNVKSVFDENSNQFFFRLIRVLLIKRRTFNENYNDFLQLLISSSKDNENFGDDDQEIYDLNEGDEFSSHKMNINIVNKIYSDEEILSQSWLFFLAGYETTATALAFCLYELALNPEVQDKLYDQLNSAFDSNEQLIYDILVKLPFLYAVISETLRLYPPFLRIERETNSEYKLGKTGITLSKGQLVHISIYAIHHSEQFHLYPQQFTPERFMPQNINQIIPYSFIPFNSGPRNCVAMRFALMEMKVCIATIVRKFKLSRSPRTDIPLKFANSTNMCKSDNVYVNIQMR